MTQLANLSKRLCIVLFLLLSFQSSLNESKDTNHNADLMLELEKLPSSLENPKAHIFSQLKKLKDPRSMAAKSNKRLNEQRIFERERFCQSFNNNRTACTEVPIDCLKCNFNYTCVYGTQVQSTCRLAYEPLNCTVSCVFLWLFWMLLRFCRPALIMFFFSIKHQSRHSI